MYYCLVWATAFLCLLTSDTTRAMAIEPDAPEALVTRDGWLSIMIGAQLQRQSPSGVMEKAERDGLAFFYSNRKGRLLWVGAHGPTARARQVLAEMSRADDWGLRAADFNLASLKARVRKAATLQTPALIAVEIAMSRAVLKYARHARGGRIDLSHVTTVIDRKPPLLSPLTVLTGIEASDDSAAFLRGLHPRHRQFHLLRAAYLDALSRERGGERRTSSLSRRLLSNMEMWRWMPEVLGATHIWANIPEYKVQVVAKGRTVHQERMIVGKTKNMTPMFSDAMETVVFKPYWNVPNSIKVKELLPSLLRGGSALRRQNLRIAYGGREVRPGSVDWSRRDIRNYHVFQPPGRGNALGKVKFLFPNKHAVYMHDTPTKHLFKKRQRAFSHGCMRVRNPLKFAEVLLKRDRGWDRGKIDRLAASGPENNRVSLLNSVPVHVAYFTAKVSASGKVTLFDDIYGHERRIQAGLADGKIIIETAPNEQNLGDVRRQIIAGRGVPRDGGLRDNQFSRENRSALGATNPEPRSVPVRQTPRRVRRATNWRRSAFQGSDS